MPDYIPPKDFVPPVDDSWDKWRAKVLEYFHDKHKDVATEMMTTRLQQEHTFYTVKKEEDSETFIYEDGIYVPHAWTTVNEFARSVLGRSYKHIDAKSVMDKIEADTYIDEKYFEEKNPEIICLLNGIFNVRTLKLQSHSPDHFFFTKVPVEYNPHARCPNWLKFLSQVMHADDIPAFQEFFGYCFYRDYPHAKALLLLGGGSNGKSTTLSIMNDVIGQENCEAIPLTALCDEPFVISRLRGKLLNSCGDNGGQTIDDVSIFKQLTGNDLITANRKNLPYILFRNYAKMVFALNNAPKFKDQSDGNWRRFMLIEFKARFYNTLDYSKLSEDERRGAHLIDEESVKQIRTAEEYSGIFNWAIEGLQRVFKNRNLISSKTTSEIRDIMVRKADPYTFFANECLEDSEGSFTSIPEIRNLYEQFSIANGLDKKINDRRLHWAIKNKFDIQSKPERIEGKLVRCFVDIKIKENVLKSFMPVTSVTDVTQNSTLLEIFKNHKEVENSVTDVTSVTPNSFSEDLIVAFIAQEKAITRSLFFDKFGEARFHEMLGKGLIFEPRFDEIRVPQ